MFKSSPSTKSPKKPKDPKTPDSGKRSRLISLAHLGGGLHTPPNIPAASASTLSFSSSPPTPKTPNFAPILPTLDFKVTPSMLSLVDMNRSPTSTPVEASAPKTLRHKASQYFKGLPTYTPTARRVASSINLHDSPPSILSLPTREFESLQVEPLQVEYPQIEESSTRANLRRYTSTELRLLMESGAKSLDLYEVQRLCLLRGVKFNGGDSKENLLKRMVVAAEVSEDAARRIRRAQERIKKRKEIASTVGIEEWELQRAV